MYLLLLLITRENIFSSYKYFIFLYHNNDLTANNTRFQFSYSGNKYGYKDSSNNFVPFEDSSDATATANKILSGFTAYAKGQKLIGTASSGFTNIEVINFNISDKYYNFGDYGNFFGTANVKIWTNGSYNQEWAKTYISTYPYPDLNVTISHFISKISFHDNDWYITYKTTTGMMGWNGLIKNSAPTTWGTINYNSYTPSGGYLIGIY